MTLTKQFRRSKNQQDKLERDLLGIAERLLAGQIAAQRQRYDEAIRALKEAVALMTRYRVRSRRIGRFLCGSISVPSSCCRVVLPKPKRNTGRI